MKRVPLKRTAFKRKPARNQRAIEAARRVVIARDGDICRAEGFAGLACSGRREVHHLHSRGTRPDLAADPRFMVSLCATHHAYVTGHPVEANAAGLHRYSWETPPPGLAFT